MKPRKVRKKKKLQANAMRNLSLSELARSGEDREVIAELRELVACDLSPTGEHEVSVQIARDGLIVGIQTECSDATKESDTLVRLNGACCRDFRERLSKHLGGAGVTRLEQQALLSEHTRAVITNGINRSVGRRRTRNEVNRRRPSSIEFWEELLEARLHRHDLGKLFNITVRTDNAFSPKGEPYQAQRVTLVDSIKQLPLATSRGATWKVNKPEIARAAEAFPSIDYTRGDSFRAKQNPKQKCPICQTHSRMKTHRQSQKHMTNYLSSVYRAIAALSPKGRRS